MRSPLAFKPIATATVNLAVTGTTGSVALGNLATQYRVYNAGSATAFINFGASGVTATLAASMPVPSGAVEVFSPSSPADTHIAAITSAGTATIYMTPGEGV